MEGRWDRHGSRLWEHHACPSLLLLWDFLRMPPVLRHAQKAPSTSGGGTENTATPSSCFPLLSVPAMLCMPGNSNLDGISIFSPLHSPSPSTPLLLHACLLQRHGMVFHGRSGHAFHASILHSSAPCTFCRHAGGEGRGRTGHTPGWLPLHFSCLPCGQKQQPSLLIILINANPAACCLPLPAWQVGMGNLPAHLPTFRQFNSTPACHLTLERTPPSRQCSHVPLHF